MNEMPDTQERGSVEGRISRLEAVVEGLAGDVKGLTQAVDHYIRSQAANTKAQWGPILAGVSVTVTIVSLIVGSLAWLIMDTRQASVSRHRDQYEILHRELDHMEVKIGAPLAQRIKENEGELEFVWKQLGVGVGDGLIQRVAAIMARVDRIEDEQSRRTGRVYGGDE